MTAPEYTEEGSWIDYAYSAASFCTGIGNHARTLYHDMWLLDTTTTSKAIQAAQLTAYSIAGLLTAVPGIVLRNRARAAQGDYPFTYSRGYLPYQTLGADGKIKVGSANIAGARAGYNYTDAGVTNLEDRIDAIVAKIVEQDADVFCLYEMYDTDTSRIIVNKLKPFFADIYWNVDKKGLGAPAGIAVFSKYKIANPEALRFPNGDLAGRTKGNAYKDAFRFEIVSNGKSVARILASHPIHSEEPAFPTEEELEARRGAMERLHRWAMEKAEDGLCTIVMGDRNCDDREYESFEEWQNFSLNNTWDPDQYTWGGDEFCVKYLNYQPISDFVRSYFPTFMGEKREKRVSGPLNLDFIVALENTYASLKTEMVDVGFDPAKLTKEALSDHNWLVATVGLHVEN